VETGCWGSGWGWEIQYSSALPAACVCADNLSFPWPGYAFGAVDDEGAGAETPGVPGGNVEIVAALEDIWRFGFKVNEG
jgi:hypothetical protein